MVTIYNNNNINAIMTLNEVILSDILLFIAMRGMHYSPLYSYALQSVPT